MANRDLDRGDDSERPVTDDDMVRGRADETDDMANESDDFEETEDLDEEDDEEDEGSF